MRIFLSYQTRDLDPAERLAQGLHRERPDLTVFVAPRALAAGAYWLPRLADELARADAVLFLVGQRIGPWQELEYYEAQRLSRQAGRNGRPLIDGTTNWPALLDELDKINYRGFLTFEYFHPYAHYPEALIWQTSDSLDRILGRKT
jgi:hypothetical protein